MERGLDTKCIHLEETEGRTDNYGAISFPIYQTATYAHPGVGKSTGYDYSRLKNPTRNHLEKVVAELEGATAAFALSSGMAAVTLLMDIFKPGDHFIIEEDLYGGSIRLFDNVLKKNNYYFTYIDCSKGDIEGAIKENTRAIYIETPTNPMMNISDISYISSIAKKHNLYLIVDNTFLSPYFQNPLKFGADIVIHSGTKFLGGHNDTLAGFIITNNEEISEKLTFLVNTIGAGLSPFDSWLILRGIKTLGVRMEKSQDNAIQIANWLKKQQIVKKVYYPGFPDHPGYEIIKRQARGFGSMITFNVDTEEHALQILERVRMIKFAESLGGSDKDKKHFSVSMQHYVFAVHAFVNVIKEYKTDKYVYTVRETKTDGVLSDVKKLKSEIGIISYSKSNKNIMKKLFREYGLEFYPLMVRNTYAYVWKGHPLTEKKEISLDELKEYPCVSFDQSSDSEFYLSEEALGDYEFDKLIKSNDRATFVEIMAQLNGYSIGTGIMTDSITFKDEFVAIKLKEEDPLTIGYIIRKNHKISDIGKAYIDELQKYKEGT